MCVADCLCPGRWVYACVAHLCCGHEAACRYMKGGSMPMLPRPLSEGLCSLLPNKTRLAVSCFWEMDMLVWWCLSSTEVVQ